MSTRIHLAQLQIQSLSLNGTISVEELDLGINDDLIQCNQSLKYELSAQLLVKEVLIEGRLELDLNCNCVRCLEPFVYPIRLNPWTCLLPVTGEGTIEMSGDSIDLTPLIRDDVLLEFPQHPLCKAECKGLTYDKTGPSHNPDEKAEASAWDALNNLKLD